MHNETRIFLITLLLISTCVEVGCSISLCECPPGKYLSEPCTQENQHPACLDCPEGRFSDTTSSAMSCQDCQIDCQQREIVIQNCTKYYNLKCQCIPGTYRPTGAHGVCLSHKPCPPGFGVIYAGNQSHDTNCKECTSGTFSPDKSLTQTCQPCRKCDSGYEEEQKCNTSLDTVCKMKDCGSPAGLTNGKVITPGTGSVVNYSCEYGFILSGPPSRTCDAGEWTYWDPVCISQERHTDLETITPILIVIVVAIIIVVLFVAAVLHTKTVRDWCKNKDLQCLRCLNCPATSPDNGIKPQNDKHAKVTTKSTRKATKQVPGTKKVSIEADDISVGEHVSLMGAEDHKLEQVTSETEGRLESEKKNIIVSASVEPINEYHYVSTPGETRVEAQLSQECVAEFFR